MILPDNYVLWVCKSSIEVSYIDQHTLLVLHIPGYQV